MKKIKIMKVLSVMLIFVFLFTLTACQTKEESNKDTANTNQSNQGKDNSSNEEDNSNAIKNDRDAGDKVLEGTITITGSTSVEKILLDMVDEFMAYNPDVLINYIGTGSSAGIEDAILGVNDLGASSRQVKDSELKEGLETMVFAYDGIALISHPNNPVLDLTKDQVLKIYSGEITNWSEVGGNDAGIIVVSREGASGTRGAFEELIGLEALTESATIVEGNGNVQTSVSGNENAIGYVSFSFIDDSVKAFTIEGALPTAEEVKAEKYPLSRPFLFAYKGDSITELTKAFLEYVVTPEAQLAVDNHGGIRVD